MKNNKPIGLGGKGEDFAVSYLENKKYKVLDRNYRTKYGEIDIIAKHQDGILVFIEVKTLAGQLDSRRSLLPEDNLSAAKLKKLQKICQFYANANPGLVGEMGWRIDLLAIVLWDPEHCRIKHYENL